MHGALVLGLCLQVAIDGGYRSDTEARPAGVVSAQLASEGYLRPISTPTPKAGKGTPFTGFCQHPIHQPTLTKAAQSEITSV